MDNKLTFSIHIKKLIDKCKKGINIMRCLAGVEWGARSHSLKRIYSVLIRSAIDYGSIIYSSAAEVWLKKVDVIQNQALRISCRAFCTSPISSILVEMGEMPLEIHRRKLRMRYWINIRGQDERHPVKKVLEDCWEYEYGKSSSFGWK